MNRISKSKRGGVIAIWIGVMFGILFLGTIYIAGSKGWGLFYQKVYDQTPDEAKSHAEKANNIWKNYPIYGSIALILAGVYFTYRQPNNDIGDPF